MTKRYLKVCTVDAAIEAVTGSVAPLTDKEYVPTYLSKGRITAEALFAAVVIPFPERPDTSWQPLLLVRDFGRLALPPLLVAFFAEFPTPVLRSFWLWLAFVPSLAVAAGRTGLTMGALPPIVGDVFVPDFLQRATVVLAIAGVVGAAVLGIWAYVSNRDNPTRRRQVEWVALGAAAGFIPYLLR